MEMKMKKSKIAAWVLAFGLVIPSHVAFASGTGEETWEPWEFMNVNVEGYDETEDADEIETYDAYPEEDAEVCEAEGESEDVDASECEPAIDPQSSDIWEEPSVAVQEDDGVSCGKAYAASRDDAIAGVYTVAKRTPLQATANAGDAMLLDMDENAEVHCYGYYTEMDGVKWFYVQYFQDGKTFTGFCGSENLTFLSTPCKMWNIL